MKNFVAGGILMVILLVLSPPASKVQGINNCVFNTSGLVMTLTANCNTTDTLLIPDGMTVDFNGFCVTGANANFKGAIVKSGGAAMYLVDSCIRTSGIAAEFPCDTGADRLRGIWFDNASGIVKGGSIIELNQSASDCEEGVALEISNTAAGPRTEVEISGLEIIRYQKSGIVANGNVHAVLSRNRISGRQGTLSANTVQCGHNALCELSRNRLDLNVNNSVASFVGTSILFYQAAPGSSITHNQLVLGQRKQRNGQVGIFLYDTDGATVQHNRTVEDNTSDSQPDIGIADYNGSGSTVSQNQVRGFITNYSNSVDPSVVPSPYQ